MVEEGQFQSFKGKGVRLDGKSETANRKASDNMQPTQVKESYNPRAHRLNHGVKTQIETQAFKGSGVSLGGAKPGLK